jgi:hypothetical protein
LSIWKTVSSSVSRQNFQCGAGSSRCLEASKTTYLPDRKLQSITLFVAPEAVSLHQKERQVKMKCIAADVFLLTMPLDTFTWNFRSI